MSFCSSLLSRFHLLDRCRSHDAVLENPLDLLEEFEHKEREAYRVAEKRFEKREINEERYAFDNPDWEPLEGKDEFMSFAEFINDEGQY